MGKEHKISIEILSHFQCSNCTKWWSIGDAPKDREGWYCPWCGTNNPAKQFNQ